MKTYVAKPGSVEAQWHLVDATDLVLGRLAVRLATILQGKHRPIYTPHIDTGDFVVIVNAEKIRLTGRKSEQKTYRYYTGWPSGLREVPYARMHERKPTEVIREAVRRMLPKSRLGRQMLTKLKIYAGPDHRHEAQKPQPLSIG